MKGGPSQRSGRFILTALGCCGPHYMREGSEELAVRCRKFSYCCIFHVTKEVGLLIPASVVAYFPVLYFGHLNALLELVDGDLWDVCFVS